MQQFHAAVSCSLQQATAVKIRLRAQEVAEKPFLVLPLMQLPLSETRRIRFQRARFQTPSSVSFCRPSPSSLSEFSLLSVCQSDVTELFSRVSPSLAQNSVSSPFRNSTLEIIFRYHFLIDPIFQLIRIYPYPMVWPLPRPWSQTMVSAPL